MSKSPNRGKKGSAGGKQSKQNQGNATAKKAKNGGKKKWYMPREWNTPKREPWNAPIHNILKAIDNHTQEYFKSGDLWHLEKAEALRVYLTELKTWIHKQEGRWKNYFSLDC